MDRRIDAHGSLISIFARDLFVHVEQVAVPLADDRLAQPLNRLGKIQINPQAARPDATACVANLLGGARGDVARSEVPVAGIFPFQKVIPLRLGNGPRRLTAILLAPGHPDAAIIAQRFGHEGEFGLMFAADGDAGGVDLGIARVGE